MSSITDRVLRGTLWVSIARIAVNVLAIMSTFVLAWFLAPEDFGLVAIASTVIFLVSVSTELSLSSALVRHAAPEESHLSAAWTLNALRSLAIGLLTCAMSWPIAQIFNDQRLVPLLCVFGGSLFISGLANPRMAIAQRDLQFWQESVVQIGQKLAGLVASFAWAYAFRDYWALVVGSVAAQFAYLILSYVVLPFRPRILFRHFKEFFGFSGWLLASQIVNTLNWRFDQFLVGKMFGAGILGTYNMGSNLAQIATREAILPLTKPLFPAFVAIREDNVRLAGAYLRVQTAITAVALPVGVGLTMIAEPLIRLFLGSQWIESVPVLQVISTIGGLQALGMLVSPLAMSLDHTRSMFQRDVAILALRIIALIGGAIMLGVSGVILGTFVTGLFTVLLNLIFVKRLIGLALSRQIMANIRSLLSVSIMAFSVFVIDQYTPKGSDWVSEVIRLGLLASSGAVIYLSSLALLWRFQGSPPGPEAEGLQVLQKVIKSVRHRQPDSGAPK